MHYLENNPAGDEVAAIGNDVPMRIRTLQTGLAA